MIIQDLAQVFDEFLTNISMGNQYLYIFLGLIIFIILLNILVNLIRR